MVSKITKLICSSTIHLKRFKSTKYYNEELSAVIPGKSPKVSTPEEVFNVLKSNQKILVHGASATPVKLLDIMTEIGIRKKLRNIEIMQMLTLGHCSYCEGKAREVFRVNSLFTGGNIRKATNEGAADMMPVIVSQMPALFRQNYLEPDVAILNLSPMDEQGFYSLGTNVEFTRHAVEKCKYIIGMVNPLMIRTFGDTSIHQSRIDVVVHMEQPIFTLVEGTPTDLERKIGKEIAEKLVDDGATIQIGIGGIPDCVLDALSNHKHLGIHTEMLSDGIVDLYLKGCITNAKKKFNRGRIIATFIGGSEKLYKFAHNNPIVELLTADYTNDTSIISQQPKMTTVNSAIEVDLTGQVCADSLGTYHYSGPGGQIDFVAGSGQSKDNLGRAIITLPSTTSKGESKIVPILKPGAGVVTPRGYVMYIVTEYGIAQMFGKNYRQRAYELIKIAHPDHQESLEKAAYERLKVKPSP